MSETLYLDLYLTVLVVRLTYDAARYNGEAGSYVRQVFAAYLLQE